MRIDLLPVKNINWEEARAIRESITFFPSYNYWFSCLLLINEIGCDNEFRYVIQSKADSLRRTNPCVFGV